ncbi:MAG: hypothetical protein L3J24_12950 [Xanthomonadales bacterium]|nr:hypothetical protein [Xanthomonadales bacterium]
MKKLSLLLLLFFMLLLTAVTAWSMPVFKAPDFMQLTIVADKMTLNGLDMKTYTFESSKPVAEIEKFYQELWSGKAKQTKVMPWNIISYADDGFLYVVQIREDNPLSSVTGLLSISDLKTLNKNFVRGKGFPMPGSSVVINDITGNDSGKRSRTLVIENTKSVADNLRYYRRHFNKKGWVELAENTNASGRKNASALMMNKGGDELNMAFSVQGNKTMVVAVQVKK